MAESGEVGRSLKTLGPLAGLCWGCQQPDAGCWNCWWPPQPWAGPSLPVCRAGQSQACRGSLHCPLPCGSRNSTEPLSPFYFRCPPLGARNRAQWQPYSQSLWGGRRGQGSGKRKYPARRPRCTHTRVGGLQRRPGVLKEEYTFYRRLRRGCGVGRSLGTVAQVSWDRSLLSELQFAHLEMG